jgi:large subunit ribosomal protein L29
MAKKKENRQDMSVKEIHSAIEHLDRELFTLRTELATQRKLEKPHLIKEKRRQKARLLTVLTQKQKEAV